MIYFQQSEVAEKFSTYPPSIKKCLLNLRRLIFEAAAELRVDGEMDETLKWGEPSYRSKHGSTLRIDWKASTPGQYFMFFHCRTRLVDTFKEIYGDQFIFDGNRAIVFNAQENIPETELKQCIKMSLNYHRIKHLPLLGA